MIKKQQKYVPVLVPFCKVVGSTILGDGTLLWSCTVSQRIVSKLRECKKYSFTGVKSGVGFLALQYFCIISIIGV